MELRFWGVRGCIPAPGKEFNRYGGNTISISLRSNDGQWAIFDAGTGIIPLGKYLMAQDFAQGNKQSHIFFTHTHWDHIQGFPFFAPTFIPKNRFEIVGMDISPLTLEDIFEEQMNPHFMPVQSLKNLASTMSFSTIDEEQTISVGAMRISAAINEHGTTKALAYRIEEDNRSVVFAPDADYKNGDPNDEILKLYQNADYLIHDCTYSLEDRKSRADRGYASIDQAAEIAARANVKHLVMIHYDQDYNDLKVDQLYTQCRAYLDEQEGGESIELIAAYEGLTINV